MDFITSLKSLLSPGSKKNKPEQPVESEIFFPEGQQQTDDGVVFAAIVNGWRVRCRITPEALQKRFGVSNQDLINGYVRNRPQIQVLVKKLIETNPSQNNYLVTADKP